MRRASKILLTLAAVFALFNSATTAVAAFLVGFITMGGGLGVGIAGVAQALSLPTSDPSYEGLMRAFTTMAVSGFSAAFVGLIVTLSIVATSFLLQVIGAVAFINVSSLDDKKAGYIISIVFGVFALLLAGELLIGLFIIIGGILGLVSCRKGKKEQEVVEAK